MRFSKFPGGTPPDSLQLQHPLYNTISIKDFLHQTLAGYVADLTENKFGPLTIKHLPLPMPLLPWRASWNLQANVLAIQLLHQCSSISSTYMIMSCLLQLNYSIPMATFGKSLSCSKNCEYPRINCTRIKRNIIYSAKYLIHYNLRITGVMVIIYKGVII